MTALRSLFRNQAIFGTALLLVGLQTGPSAQEKHAPQANGHTGAVAIQMKNVNLMLARDIVFEVRTLRGELQRTKPDVPVTFDDSDSFVLEADSGEIAIGPASLSALMNSYHWCPN